MISVVRIVLTHPNICLYNKMSRLRNFVFTFNNYELSDEMRIQKWCIDNCKYAVYGRETGDSGTRHLQGYAELSKQTAFSVVKKALGDTIHIESRKGSAKQADDYCKKEDPSPFTHGQLSRPGNRTDIHDFTEAVLEGKKVLEILQEHPREFCKYYKVMDRLRYEVKKSDNKFEAPEVYIFWGEAGAGKTRRAHEESPDLYIVAHEKGRPLWWDGYDGQEAILIDDFYGGAIAYSTMLRLLDGYKFQLPVKGGFTWKEWKKVYITSNQDPRTWYPEGLSPAFQRRITQIVHFGSPLVKIPHTRENCKNMFT